MGLDPIRATGLGIFAALGAVAFATALRPLGYGRASGLAVALVLGIAASLLLLLILRSLFGRFLSRDDSRIHYLALAAALGLLVAGAAVRLLAAGADGQSGRLVQERQDFLRWTQAAAPLIVRYTDVLRVDAPLVRGLRPSRPEPGLRLRIQRAERILLGLEHSSAPLAARSPPDLRSFMPLLRRALALALTAQQAYVAGLSPHAARPSARTRVGRDSAVFLRRGNRLLHRSRQAMAAFTTRVNDVGAQLFTR